MCLCRGNQSFRFGPNIGYLVSCVLDVLKGIHRQTITGNLQEGQHTKEFSDQGEEYKWFVSLQMATLEPGNTN